MRIKVKLRPFLNLFSIGGMSVREILRDIPTESPILGGSNEDCEQLLTRLEEKYPTLEQLNDAEEEDIIQLIGEKAYEELRKVISVFIEKKFMAMYYVMDCDYIPLVTAVAYGMLANDAEIYCKPIMEIRRMLFKLPTNERDFLVAHYGLSCNDLSMLNESEIANKLGITGSVDLFKKNALKHLSKVN